MSNINEVTDGTFKTDILDSKEPVAVDFWAPWCAPCQMVAPVLEALNQKMSGKIKFFKINTDENPQTAQQYKIMAIPSLLIFKEGKEIDRVIGYLPEDQLEARLQKITENHDVQKKPGLK